jgi:SAM-dependent methyltransferase
MPGSVWYEQMYAGRDIKLLPLEPGHKYFLADTLTPGHGRLLDVGCGTGNFLIAANKAGYEVSGTELDRNAARFVREHVGLSSVFPLTVSEFAEQHPDEKFDVVTFFEVLEHQTAPVEFVQKIKLCLQSRGYIALSVPNRERWQTVPDVLDYPPNHFLRWNVAALTNFLSEQGFEILSVHEQAASVAHTAQMINASLRTGLAVAMSGGTVASFRDLIQMSPEQAASSFGTAPTPRQRVTQILGRVKRMACFPLALIAFPYVRMRSYKGTYLYCLARLRG